jgi:hypothetical protein
VYVGGKGKLTMGCVGSERWRAAIQAAARQITQRGCTARSTSGGRVVGIVRSVEDRRARQETIELEATALLDDPPVVGSLLADLTDETTSDSAPPAISTVCPRRSATLPQLFVERPTARPSDVARADDNGQLPDCRQGGRASVAH